MALVPFTFPDGLTAIHDTFVDEVMGTLLLPVELQYPAATVNAEDVELAVALYVLRSVPGVYAWKRLADHVEFCADMEQILADIGSYAE